MFIYSIGGPVDSTIDIYDNVIFMFDNVEEL